MKNEEINSVNKKNQNQVNLVTISPKEMASFLLNLIGQRRTIEHNISNRIFNINIEWLHNLNQIIDQRIMSQNQAHIASFQIKIYYDNGRITTLQSIDDFNRFNDINNATSVGVDIKWTYLLQFRHSEKPESQNIRFRAFSDTSIQSKTRFQMARSYFDPIRTSKEELFLAIEYTDITWGEDIYNHMNNYILSSTSKPPILNRISVPVRPSIAAPLLASTTLISMLYSLERQINAQHDMLNHKYQSVADIIKSHSFTNKLNFLIDLSLINLSKNLNMSIFIFPISVAMIFIFYATASEFKKRSHISTNQASINKQKKIDTLYNYVMGTIISGFIISVLASLFANQVQELFSIYLPQIKIN